MMILLIKTIFEPFTMFGLKSNGEQFRHREQTEILLKDIDKIKGNMQIK